jgi:hypothetical protein
MRAGTTFRVAVSLAVLVVSMWSPSPVQSLATPDLSRHAKVWKSALQMQLDKEFPSDAFKASLSHQRALVTRSGGRAPALICCDRSRGVMHHLAGMIHGADRKLRIVHSAGEMACILLSLSEKDLRNLEGEPGFLEGHHLPHAAKLAPSLHAERMPDPSGLVWSGGRPVGLDLSLSPGADPSVVHFWTKQLHQSEGLQMSQYLTDALGLEPLEKYMQAGTARSSGGMSQSAARLWQESGEEVERGLCSFERLSFSGSGLEHVSVAGLESLTDGCLVALIGFLLAQPHVCYIEDLPSVVAHNIQGSWIVQSGEQGSYPLWDAGLRGETEVVGVADSGLDMRSCFFSEEDPATNVKCSTYNSPVTDRTKRKVVQYIGFTDCDAVVGDHGTHVSGTVAGAIQGQGAGHHIGDGGAHDAKLAFFDFGDSSGALFTPSNLALQMLAPAYAAGARVFSNSWGAIRSTYTSLDRQLDAWAYSNPDSLILVAAGNCGDSSGGCEYLGIPLNGQGSVLSPALGKNVLTVGASENVPSTAGLEDNIDEVAYFSGQGPLADDGRIKPDVVAPGYHLFSARAETDSSCGVEAMAGTSMATPLVAGYAAIIRQYFVQGWYPSGSPNPSNMFNPSGALVKAVLIGSTVPMNAFDGRDQGYVLLDSPPDGYQGFGRVMVDSVLNVAGSSDLFVADRILLSDGDVMSYSFNMPPTVGAYEGQMTITMTFFEQEAAAFAVAPVFNDVDLLVTAFDANGGATVFYPNNLAGPDTVNTVEKVVIPDPRVYSSINVTVTGASIVTSDLPVTALVVNGGQAVGYSAGAPADDSWYVLARMVLRGAPPEEAVLDYFAAALGQGFASASQQLVAPDGVVLARLRLVEGVQRSSDVTLDFYVSTYGDGEDFMAFLLAVSDLESAEQSDLVNAINGELAAQTTSGCVCVSTGQGGYNCDSCTDGDPYTPVSAVELSEGQFSLLTTQGGAVGESTLGGTTTPKIKVSFFDNLLRTSTAGYVIAVCAIVSLVSAFGAGIVYYRARQAGLASPRAGQSPGGIRPASWSPNLASPLMGRQTSPAGSTRNQQQPHQQQVLQQRQSQLQPRRPMSDRAIGGNL